MKFSKVVQTLPILLLLAVLTSCSTSQDQSNDSGKSGQTASYPDPSPSPGTAEAVFKVLNVVESGTNSILDVEIISAGKFGSAVPPIPKGSGMKLAISNALLNAGSIKKGSTFKSVLSFAEALGDSPSWRIVKLLNQD